VVGREVRHLIAEAREGEYESAYDAAAARFTAASGTIGGMRHFLAACFLVLAPAFAGAQAPHDHQHSFDDAEKWARVFDDPARDAWQKPQAVIEALALAPAARIADLGAGTGYFTVRLASMLPEARVYAVEIEPNLLRYIKARARREHLGNVVAIKGAPDDPRLPEKVDLVLVVDTYHHIAARAEYFRRLRSALRPGGRIAIIDFTLDSPYGPPRSARLAPAAVTAEMDTAGYAVAAQHDFLPYQYFLVFEPAS
jgi:SAM-dependent methyltransferase